MLKFVVFTRMTFSSQHKKTHDTFTSNAKAIPLRHNVKQNYRKLYYLYLAPGTICIRFKFVHFSSIYPDFYCNEHAELKSLVFHLTINYIKKIKEIYEYAMVM